MIVTHGRVGAVLIVAALGAWASGCAETVQVRPILSAPPRPSRREVEVAPVTSRALGLVGAPAPAFEFPDLAGQRRSLDELLASGHVVVLEWIDPTRRAWRDQHRRRGDLHRAFRRFDPEGVQWVGICSFDPHADAGAPRRGGGPAVLPFGEAEARRRCRAASNELGLMFPVLLDAGGEVARAYRVERAPHVVVIDRDGRIVFDGAPEPVRPPPATPLTRALSAVLGGEGPGPSSVPAGGAAPTTTAPPLPEEDSPDDTIEEEYVGEEEPADDGRYEDFDIEETYLDEEDQ